MQALKLLFLGLLLFVLVRFAPIYYQANEFDKYVQQQVAKISSKATLTEVILQNAEKNRIPVTAQNINFSTIDSVLRVSVDYAMPLDLLIFHRDLKFHAAGSGLPHDN